MSVVCLLLIFELIQRADLVNLMLHLNIFKIFKINFEDFEGKIAYLLPCGLFFP